MKRRLAIITSHPIQYNAPLFALLSKEQNIELMVFYTWGEACLGEKYDPDFGKVIEWDIPLLDGYNYIFVTNTSSNQGSHHFKGIINPTLNQEIEAWKPDAIWVWGWAFDSHLKVMRHFKGKVPVWFRGDSTLLDEPKGFSLKKIARRIFLTWIYLNIDKAFYVGTHNKAYFKKHRLKESQLVYAPHAVDNDRFSDESGEKTLRAMEWRQELGYSESDMVILFAGKFEPRKNPFFLIDLMKATKESNVKLLFVGNGPLESELKKQSKSDERIQFLDFQNQSDMPVIYRMANLFALPSKSETWGLSINEALVSSTNVIASELCGGAIDLINQSNGKCFHPEIDLLEVQKYIEKRDFIKCKVENNALLVGHSYIDIINCVKIELIK